MFAAGNRRLWHLGRAASSNVNPADWIVKTAEYDNHNGTPAMLGLTPVDRPAVTISYTFCMQDGSQIFIPDSFIALFQGRQQRLQVPLSEVAARYELCEDLAQMLVEQAQILYHQSAPSESAILQTMFQGLQADGAVVSPSEARWVILRLAELLNWQTPELLLPERAD